MLALRSAVQSSISSSFWAKPHLVYPGVYTLPPLLDSEDIVRILQSAGPSVHDEPEDGHHIGKAKPSHLPWVAEKIWPFVASLDNECKPHSVDPMMKLYRLEAGQGAVTPHKDLDFNGPHGSKALWSILLYLSDNYEGGETVFDGTTLAPPHSIGAGLLFRHDLLHEGRKVYQGTKYVLKTDLFVLPR